MRRSTARKWRTSAGNEVGAERDILKGQKFEYVTKEVKRGGGLQSIEHIKSTKPPTNEARAFYFSGDDTVKWYWIDFEEEWP